MPIEKQLGYVKRSNFSDFTDCIVRQKDDKKFREKK
jgi:hypothetical protein